MKKLTAKQRAEIYWEAIKWQLERSYNGMCYAICRASGNEDSYLDPSTNPYEEFNLFRQEGGVFEFMNHTEDNTDLRVTILLLCYYMTKRLNTWTRKRI